jgi:hypothetical protein
MLKQQNEPQYADPDDPADPLNVLRRRHAPTLLHRRWSQRNYCAQCAVERGRRVLPDDEPGVIQSRA